MLSERNIQNGIHHLIPVKDKIHISHCLDEYKSLYIKEYIYIYIYIYKEIYIL